MGKRKGGSAMKAKKRIALAANELLDEQITNKETAKLQSKENDDLFVLDTQPNQRSKRSLTSIAENATAKRRKQSGVISITTTPSSSSSPSKSDTKTKPKPKPKTLTIQQTKRNRISSKDERQIKAIIKHHDKDEDASKLKSQMQELVDQKSKQLYQRKRTKRVAGTAKASFDLWGADADTATSTNTKQKKKKQQQQKQQQSKKQIKTQMIRNSLKPKTVPVQIAQPGQSYKPDEEQHQDVIGEALSIELRRKDALDYKNAPIGGKGLKKATLALIVGSSDEEDSDDDSDDDNDSDVDMEGGSGRSTKTVVKRKEKLTRAQRNKQKRVKALEVALQEKRRAKKYLNQFADTKKIAKEIRKHEAETLAKREEIRELKEEAKARPFGLDVHEELSKLDPIHAPSLPVALTDEIKGKDATLRSIKPKGSLLTDRVQSMISRKMANRRALTKRNIVQGKRRKMKGGKGRDYLLI